MNYTRYLLLFIEADAANATVEYYYKYLVISPLLVTLRDAIEKVEYV